MVRAASAEAGLRTFSLAGWTCSQPTPTTLQKKTCAIAFRYIGKSWQRSVSRPVLRLIVSILCLLLKRRLGRPILSKKAGRESLEIKNDMYRRMSQAAPPDTPLVSSSSFFLVSDLQRTAVRPERVVLGHPFNPPHLIPLVEVAGSSQTSEAAIDRVMNFYKRIGKKPIRLRREIFGHIANRLQTALWREAFHLIASGVASAEDVDTAMTEGPGIRGAVLGPCMVWHVSGGKGGIRSTVSHMGPPTSAMTKKLYDGEITDDIYQKVVESTELMAAGRDADELRRMRDEGLLKVVAAKKGIAV